MVIKLIKDLEEANKLIEKYCTVCDSTNVSVRFAKYKWYYVGCLDCWNKMECDEANLEYAIELWNERVIKCKKLKNMM